mmetsp:Transcript_14761/g.21823  ORF Transcript_14761/g.21823 Transcript_14761/m.21823 type:complete len:424 (+) Transcript_14761:293-1564(+)
MPKKVKGKAVDVDRANIVSSSISEVLDAIVPNGQNDNVEPTKTKEEIESIFGKRHDEKQKAYKRLLSAQRELQEKHDVQDKVEKYFEKKILEYRCKKQNLENQLLKEEQEESRANQELLNRSQLVTHEYIEREKYLNEKLKHIGDQIEKKKDLQDWKNKVEFDMKCLEKELKENYDMQQRQLWVVERFGIKTKDKLKRSMVGRMMGTKAELSLLQTPFMKKMARDRAKKRHIDMIKQVQLKSKNTSQVIEKSVCLSKQRSELKRINDITSNIVSEMEIKVKMCETQIKILSEKFVSMGGDLNDLRMTESDSIKDEKKIFNNDDQDEEPNHIVNDLEQTEPIQQTIDEYRDELLCVKSLEKLLSKCLHDCKIISRQNFGSGSQSPQGIAPEQVEDTLPPHINIILRNLLDEIESYQMEIDEQQK